MLPPERLRAGVSRLGVLTSYCGDEVVAVAADRRRRGGSRSGRTAGVGVVDQEQVLGDGEVGARRRRASAPRARTRGRRRSRRRPGCVRRPPARRRRPRRAVERAQAGDRLREFALAVAGDAGDADDLARAHLEVDAADGLDAAVAAAREAAHLEPTSPVWRGGCGSCDGSSADHHLGELVPRHVLRQHRPDPAPVPQHGDPVGEREHLADLVRDEDEPEPSSTICRRTTNRSSTSCGVSTAVGSSRISSDARRGRAP